MIEINLVPDVKQELIKAQRIRLTVTTVSIIIGVISIGVVVLLAVYIFAFQAIRSGLEDGAIKDGNVKLQAVPDLAKTLTIQNQLTQISQLNSQKNIDSRVFDVLGAIIPAAPNNVAISALSLDAPTNVITIQAQAPNGYAAAEIFKKSIEGAQVKYTDAQGAQSKALATNVNLSNTSYGQDSTGVLVLQFTISFTYDQSLFSPLSSNVSVALTNSGNVTDSYLGVPTSIFAAPATAVKGGS